MNWITKLFKSKTGDSKNSVAWTPFGVGSQGPKVNSANLLENNKNWVFIAVDRIASACSGVRLKVMRYKKNGDDEEIFEGPLVSFLDKPHPRLTGRDFVYLNSAYKEIAGNAFWEIDGEGKDRRLIPLIPTHVKPITDNAGILVGYKYTEGTKERSILPEKMLHDRIPSPSNPFWGVGPLERIAEWVDTDTYASEFNRMFFVNGAAFGGVLETDEESKERIELIKTGWAHNQSGLKNMHKVPVLPKNTKFKEMTQTMRDMQFTELDATYRDKILAGFGVPKTLAGLVTEVNRASAEASEYVFAAYTIKPKMDRFVDFLNNFVVPLFDNSGQIYIAYDDFIPENMDVKLREIEIALNRQPYMTINEVRASKGLPKITGGDTVYGNPFAAPIGEPVESKQAHEHVHKDAHEIMAEKAFDLINKANPTDEKAEKDRMAHKAFVSRVEAYQKQTASKIRDFNNKQKIEVLQNLGRATKDVSKDDLFDVDGQVGVMIDIVSPILRGLLTEQVMQEWLDQGFDGQVDTSKESLTKIIERSAKRLAKSYNDTTAQLLKRTLNEGINGGEGLDRLTKRVESVYEFSDSYRAPMVAHTETFYVANEASREAYRQSGVVKTIRWYTADSDACEFCEPLNGEEIGIDENFYDKGDTVVGANGGKLTMDYRTLDVPPIHPNCRCFIRPEEISV